MRRLGDIDPFSLGQSLKEISDIPIILLLNNAADISYLPEASKRKGIDRIFLWNGDSKVFVAIIKHLEDIFNVEYDTRVGLVRVIIVVEDSIRFYSLFLPLIYSELMKQTHRLISDGLNDFYNLLQMRARPKILLAETYEEVLDFYQKYRKYVIGIISDIKFPRNNIIDRNAGFNFIKYVKNDNPTLPVAIQSDDPENRSFAKELGAYFIDKKSRKLLKSLSAFMLRYLGFGDFIFRLRNGKIVGKAGNIFEMHKLLATVPGESIVYHGENDHFSGWLMNRAEFTIAQKIKPRKVSDFSDTEKIRHFLLEAFGGILEEAASGVIHDFSRDSYKPMHRFSRLRPGSLGGKGRGIAFLQFLLNSFLLSDDSTKKVLLRIPKTFVIGTDEFDRFMEENEDLYDIALSDAPDDVIKGKFIKAKLHNDLKKDLFFILKDLIGPITVRSSSLLEDSQYQPFAGVFETYMLPNNQNIKIRLKLLCESIKLVYASSFLKQAKSYAEATGQSIEESKMAVIIQKVVGRSNNNNNFFYPCFSGVANSYNYYPISYMRPEDRIVFLALGLGKTIVDGGKSLRFCPKYPEISFFSTQDQLLDNSQNHFFAINLKSKDNSISKGEDSFLVKKSIYDAEISILSKIADTYDFNDRVIRLGYTGEGSPIITFSLQLKYETFPLIELITKILEIGEQAMGCSVEIEFAGCFPNTSKEKNTFYLLQIRPFTEQDDSLIEEVGTINSEDILVRSSQVSGNRIIKDIFDIVFVKPESFDKLKTQEMVSEIDGMNTTLCAEKRSYILIGPGRWGSFDQFLGIPVKWNNISGVKVIIEAGLKDFQVEHSQGSHFFQNITTANIGYFYTKYGSKNDNIDWNWLNNPILLVSETKYIRHIRSTKPFLIIINGKKREGIIVKPINKKD